MLGLIAPSHLLRGTPYGGRICSSGVARSSTMKSYGQKFSVPPPRSTREKVPIPVVVS
jgi:hypothetical protein